MRQTGSAPADTSGTSGIEYIKFAASGRNRFVTLIALLAALGGFLFGYDTGIIGQALPFVQKQFHAGTVVSSWIVASVLIGAIIGAAGSGYLADKISRKWTKFLSPTSPGSGWPMSARATGGGCWASAPSRRRARDQHDLRTAHPQVAGQQGARAGSAGGPRAHQDRQRPARRT